MNPNSTNPSNPREDEPTPTNEIGHPQYERTLEHFYLWTSGGSLKHKLREFAVRYENGRRDGESEAYLDQMYNAIISFFDKREATMKAEWEAYAIKGALNRLNDKLFYSTTNPDGQFIKDCIFEELEKTDELAAQTNGEGNE